MILAREVWPNGKVIAVEGTGHNAEIARRNLELNAVKNVEIINAVIGEKDGDEVMFSSTLNGSVSIGGVGESVESVTIDTLALRHGVPDVVFVDVEGYECQALSGASAVLNSNADFLIEVHEGCGLQDHGNKELVLSFFQPSRFHCFISFPEGAPFERWHHGNALPEARFFLVARSISR